MSSHNQSYGSGYSDFLKAFTTEEVEELLFFYPSSRSGKMEIWGWANNYRSSPSSPSALSALSRDSSPFLLGGGTRSQNGYLCVHQG
ncbi:hypothetical protein O181_103839 [Austropuccinia psidii MF-1]|uniref:Uncharacterized protein n=1 Tax=Austropuccinia psidii MF-1 TaxID=1389203 RepID=A0A9Q3PJL4_9BASI|nr:hypothetical protein [Austropuccinia psidii MF-1]